MPYYTAIFKENNKIVHTTTTRAAHIEKALLNFDKHKKHQDFIGSTFGTFDESIGHMPKKMVIEVYKDDLLLTSIFVVKEFFQELYKSKTIKVNTYATKHKSTDRTTRILQ